MFAGEESMSTKLRTAKQEINYIPRMLVVHNGMKPLVIDTALVMEAQRLVPEGQKEKSYVT